jgi:hypothetical protein
MILMSSCYFVPDPADPRSREGTDITKLRRRRAGTFRRTDARDSTDSEIGVATERTPLARPSRTVRYGPARNAACKQRKRLNAEMRKWPLQRLAERAAMTTRAQFPR